MCILPLYTHGGLRGAYVRFARAAKFTVSSEPSTYSILQGVFSTPDQLKALFPKYNDPAASRRRVALKASLGDVRNAPDAASRREIVAGIVASERSNPPPPRRRLRALPFVRMFLLSLMIAGAERC